MTTSGPAHTVTLEPGKRRWRAQFNNHVIADTDDALILHETKLSPVVYFPRDDVAMEYMGRTTHHTHCPFKGDAAYWTLTMDGEILENVAWSYETPLANVEPISGRVAFYTRDIQLYEIDDALVNPHPHDRKVEPEPRIMPVGNGALERAQIDEIIQHTDAGDGTTQREHWPSNVETPGAEEGRVR